ncbi:MAG: RNA pyrophosphohydrolase [Bosea sp. (in: a-proteobacteria)]|uniref:RNA pyrophosphohydrolase n=1 Tax=Bosea sp. (in: a-proteobacteria) TaxID=1871050 RepID=UPI002736FD5F|nr:RNA pyrophosphohydrolase [Bosea sp. (in: a-proteobacteria)]MDP3256009.1 RNA pyrophosphohydrolase [Bosea sp. (in: a-proteobacteria)]MDP3319408.1 RNA pyrophosphohydrolase [Bosea sp. (in: a-proteobacteria)]
MISDVPPDGYRPCVGLALFNPDGLVFIGRRANKSLREHVAPGHEWQMPQGGIDAGETPLQAATRELQEETNVTSVSLLAESPGWLAYDLPAEIGKQAWKGRWRGQAQKWFAFRLTGPESEIDIATPAGGHKAEFDAWRWERLERTPALIIPFKQGVYREVAALFAPFAAA